MPIQYEPTGYGASIQQLAEKAGAAEGATKAAEMAFQMAEADKQRQFQAQMENLHYEMQLEGARRSAMWDIEKMETRSRIDFQEEEQKRTMRKQQLDLDMQALDKAAKERQIDPVEDLPKLKKATLLRYLDLPEASKQLFETLTQQQVMGKEAQRQLDLLKTGGQGGAGGPTGMAPTGTTPTAPIVPTGSSVSVPIQRSQIYTTGTGQIRGITELGQDIGIEDTKHYRVVDSSTGQAYDITGDEFRNPKSANYRLVNEVGKAVSVETPAVKLSKEDQELSEGEGFWGPTAKKFFKSVEEVPVSELKGYGFGGTGYSVPSYLKTKGTQAKSINEQLKDFPISSESKTLLGEIIRKLIQQESDKAQYPGYTGKW